MSLLRSACRYTGHLIGDTSHWINRKAHQFLDWDEHLMRSRSLIARMWGFAFFVPTAIASAVYFFLWTLYLLPLLFWNLIWGPEE